MVPKHVAIIMDGNGRWAKQRHLSRVFGHRQGGRIIRKLLEYSADCGIEVLTFFAFSTENWKRPVAEIRFLMSLLVRTLRSNLSELHESGVRIRIIGDCGRLDEAVRSIIEEAHTLTKHNKRITLVLAVNYSGRWDILQATEHLLNLQKSGQLSTPFTETVFQSALSLAGLPDPDFMIRTSGEQRISNFFLWQLAYTELYFTPCLWPDFTIEEYQKALRIYAERERRFGGVEKNMINEESLLHE